MKTQKLTLAAGIFFCLAVAVGQEPTTRPLTPAEELELKTLAGQLTDPAREAKTKTEAALLLLTKPYAQAGDLLRDLLADPSNRAAGVAVAEAIAIRGGGRVDFIDPLMAMLTGKEPSVREPAARALLTYKDGGVVEKFVAAASDAKTERATRLVMIGSLQRVLDKKAVDALVQLLYDRDAAIRDAAVDSLTKLTSIRTFGNDRMRWILWWQRNKDKDRYDWLAELAASMSRSNTALELENSGLRERLGRALSDLYASTPAAQRDALLLSFLKDPLDEARLVGMKLTERKIAAGEPVPPEVRAQVRSMLSDDEPRVREASALLLANLGDAEAVAALLERLKSEEVTTTRQAVLTALGQLRDARALPAVIREVQSKYENVAASAAAALTKIASKQPLDGAMLADAVRALTERYKSAGEGAEGAALREALLGAMGVVGDKAFGAVLQGALKDPSASARLAAVNGLAQLNQVASAGELAQLLAVEPDRSVRRAAIAALKTLGGPDYLNIILQRTNPAVESDADVRAQAWDVAMGWLAKANQPVLESTVEGLASRGDAVQQRIKIMQMLVDVLKADKSPKLAALQWQLGKALSAASRPAEASPHMKEAYELFLAANNSQAAAVWVEWVGVLLAGDDPQAPKAMAEQVDNDSYEAAVKQLMARLAALKEDEKYVPLILLAGETIKQLAPRLTVEQREAIEKMLALAKARQLEADQKRISELAPQLLAADEAARKAAAAEIQAMGDRAVRHLLRELRKSVASDKPNGQLEKALLAVLAPLAPQLTGYDPAAPQAERIKLIDGWLEKLPS